ncbi:MAG: phosphatase PAP2 family protein [Planctomycetaceae bacterium]
MPARRFANFKRVEILRWELGIGLLGLLLAGCQSAPLRSVPDRPAPAPQVSDNMSRRPLALGSAERAEHEPDKNEDGTWTCFTPTPSAWESSRLTTPRAHADGVAVKDFRLMSPFLLVCWQNEEPPPLVSSESCLCSEHPLSKDGPAEDCQQFSIGDDLEHALPRLWSDTQALANWNNALILTAAGGLAIGFREGEIDQRVRDNVAQHPLRWGEGSRFLGGVGEVKYQAPVMLGVYGYSVWAQDEELHDLMGTMLSASAITGVSTSALKLFTNTDRPSNTFQNGRYGFPSYHTASTFAIAAVLDEYYGCQVGLPAYALATAVGFSRIDERVHDLSDVVFGAALGFVIGKAVAQKHQCDDSKCQFSAYIHPTDGTPGIAWEVKY